MGSESTGKIAEYVTLGLLTEQEAKRLPPSNKKFLEQKDIYELIVTQKALSVSQALDIPSAKRRFTQSIAQLVQQDDVDFYTAINLTESQLGRVEKFDPVLKALCDKNIISPFMIVTLADEAYAQLRNRREELAGVYINELRKNEGGSSFFNDHPFVNAEDLLDYIRSDPSKVEWRRRIEEGIEEAKPLRFQEKLYEYYQEQVDTKEKVRDIFQQNIAAIDSQLQASTLTSDQREQLEAAKAILSRMKEGNDEISRTDDKHKQLLAVIMLAIQEYSAKSNIPNKENLSALLVEELRNSWNYLKEHVDEEGIDDELNGEAKIVSQHLIPVLTNVRQFHPESTLTVIAYDCAMSHLEHLIVCATTREKLAQFDQLLDEIKINGIGVIWPHIKTKVAQAIHGEFDSWYGSGDSSALDKLIAQGNSIQLGNAGLNKLTDELKQAIAERLPQQAERELTALLLPIVKKEIVSCLSENGVALVMQLMQDLNDFNETSGPETIAKIKARIAQSMFDKVGHYLYSDRHDLGFVEWLNAFQVGNKLSIRSLERRLNFIAEFKEHPEILAFLVDINFPNDGDFGFRHVQLMKNFQRIFAEMTNDANKIDEFKAFLKQYPTMARLLPLMGGTGENIQQIMGLSDKQKANLEKNVQNEMIKTFLLTTGIDVEITQKMLINELAARALTTFQVKMFSVIMENFYPEAIKAYDAMILATIMTEGGRLHRMLQNPSELKELKLKVKEQQSLGRFRGLISALEDIKNSAQNKQRSHSTLFKRSDAKAKDQGQSKRTDLSSEVVTPPRKR